MKVILAANEQDFLIGLLKILRDLELDVDTTQTEEGIIVSFLTDSIPCHFSPLLSELSSLGVTRLSAPSL